MTRPETFKDVQSWLDEVKEYANPTVSMVLVGNKVDLQEKYERNNIYNRRQVTKEEALAYATSNGMEYLETSAKEGKNVSQV
jgi:GTPase SAR1 family protein